MTEVFKGRPTDIAGRLERETRVYDYLDALGIEYDRADHERAETMSICEEISKVLNTKICKNLFLCNRQQTVFYLLMMPGDKPFKTKELSAQINSSRLSFATPEHMLSLLDIEPGAVSVMGLMNDREKKVNLLVDRDLLQDETIGIHPCVCTSCLKMRTEDVFGPFLHSTGHSMTTVELVGVE